MPTTIKSIDLLPTNPYAGTQLVSVIITTGVPSYFKVTGTNLDGIVSVNWLPKYASSVEFTIRQMILVDKKLGTFMVMVTNNYLDDTDRKGNIIFRLLDGTTLSFPVTTFGPVTASPLWTAPTQGLITG
jgi:hypothetical protein